MHVHSRAWTGHVFVGASLDGFIARPDGDLGWLTDPPPEPTHAAVVSDLPVRGFDAFLAGIDHVVMGRGTYEKVLTFGFWPYAPRPVIVLSTALDTDDERITIARSLDEALRLLEQDSAAHVYVDGGQVIQTFLRADLIDEIDVAWAPVLIGSGLPLFGALGREVRLSLTASSADEGGMVHASYRVHRPAHMSR
ncbi:MAG TPA: dihydrofolate reductase family protein [Propionibacteriaceae bacterium]|nr:dihydrofolate reductase family protein [Propionibacteriaceae bacterium]